MSEKLSERYYEMWGLTEEGGEERTYSIAAEVAQLEAEIERLREFKKAVTREGGLSVVEIMAWADTANHGSIKTYLLQLVDAILKEGE